MTYFDLSKPSLAYLKPMYNCNGNIPDEVALKATCIKHVTLKIAKIRTGCQYIGYFSSNENLNCTAKNFRLGHMRPTRRRLDIDGLMKPIVLTLKKKVLQLYHLTFKITADCEQ